MADGGVRGVLVLVIPETAASIMVLLFIYISSSIIYLVLCFFRIYIKLSTELKFILFLCDGQNTFGNSSWLCKLFDKALVFALVYRALVMCLQIGLVFSRQFPANHMF